MRQTTLLTVFLSSLLLVSAARAEIRTLPGSTTEIAAKPIGCFIMVDGHVLINGICHSRTNIETADVFMTLPEAATQISFAVSRRLPWRAVTLWMQANGTRGLGIVREEKEDCRPTVPSDRPQGRASGAQPRRSVRA